MSELVQHSMEDYLRITADDITSKCTTCGKCVEVCPIVPPAGLSDASPKAIVSGVLDALLDKTKLDGDSYTWVDECHACGDCIPACPEGINPRQMVLLASQKKARDKPTSELFRKMSRAIRLLVAMQLGPDDVSKLLAPKPERDLDVIFYMGCNAIRTPHLMFNSMSILDAIEVDYDVLGGPNNCCGVIHSKWEGNVKTGGRMANSTLVRFGEYKPTKVMNWCPTCMIHLGETIKGYRAANFDFDHVGKLYVERMDILLAKMTHPVNMTVVVHAHEGMFEVSDWILTILRAIPGLTIKSVAIEPSYNCGGNGLDRAPLVKDAARAETIRQCKEEGVDAIVSLYHTCHLQLGAAAAENGFKVLNYTDLICMALGIEPRADALQAMRMLGDWNLAAEAATPALKENGVTIDAGYLADIFPELASLAEYRGGLCSFSSSASNDKQNQ